MNTLTKVKIIGRGGHGVKFLANALAKLLSESSYHVSVIYDYDAAVKGGSIEADLLYSSKPINNPLIDKADVCLSFVGPVKIRSNKFIDLTDKKWALKISELEPSIRKNLNMVALGILLNSTDINLNEKKLALTLGLDKNNVIAVAVGHGLKQAN